MHLACKKLLGVIDFEINGAVDVVFRCQEKQSVSKSEREKLRAAKSTSAISRARARINFPQAAG